MMTGFLALVRHLLRELLVCRALDDRLGDLCVPVACRWVELAGRHPHREQLHEIGVDDAFGENPGVDGSHATAAEVSLAQYYQQAHIKHAQMTPKVAAPSGQFFEGADYRARYPDGRIGSDPSLSSPEHGKLFYEAAVADMIDAYKVFLDY